MKILCYGDSNTYGWDPRYFGGGRYDRVWTDILGEAGHDVTVHAMPGRQIPHVKRPLQILQDQLRDHYDLMIIMMGSNDIEATLMPDMVEERMRTFLKAVRGWDAAERYLIVGPPVIDATRELEAACREMNERFRALASEFTCDYVDSAAWGLALAHDRCHLTEEDQGVFAKHILEAIEV